MFQSKTVRVFSGILLGSVAGVGWGAYYHALHYATFARGGGELDKMIDLLACIMIGAGGGFLVGLAIGAAKYRWIVLLVSLAGVCATFFLPPGMGFLPVSQVEETLLMSEAVVLGLAVLAFLGQRLIRSVSQQTTPPLTEN
ncbi:MAG TPA: hypothetical protein PLX06_11195 [Fimbriimonadaceae bacterium]|nr:hypothetical protein [Fimbriimonadaceae bacterium]